MAYNDRLASDDSWRAFEEALEESVHNYVESFADHLADDYENYNVTVRGIDSREELVDILGLEDYSVNLSAEDGDFRAYDIDLPDVEQPLMVEVERSVAENSIAGDEDRETVAYTMIARSDYDRKFENIRSEFCRVTSPDTVQEDSPVFYRPGKEHPLRQIDSWEVFDDEEIMKQAVDFYEESYGVEAEFDVELGFDSGKDWRIYEFDFDDIDEPLHLEIALRDFGFSMNWRPDEYGLRYRNFVREGFAKVIENFND